MQFIIVSHQWSLIIFLYQKQANPFLHQLNFIYSLVSICYVFLGHYTNLLLWYYEFYPTLKASVYEKYNGNFVGRQLILEKSHIKKLTHMNYEIEYFCCSMNKLTPCLERTALREKCCLKLTHVNLFSKCVNFLGLQRLASNLR